MNEPTILRQILQRKREELAERRKRCSLVNLQHRIRDLPPARGFAAALETRILAGQAGVIAEIKKASPSKGVIREDFDPETLARSYESAGAACLSVLTDVDYFQGADAYLQAARNATALPVLRKDFIIDAYQVVEARALEADCILLIAAIFMDDPERMADLAGLAEDSGLDVLIEAHNAAELAAALEVPGRLVGINNRDLHSFDTSLQTTLGLLAQVPKDRIVVTESGIAERDDVVLMRGHGVNAFLVGESLMRAQDPGARLREMFFA